MRIEYVAQMASVSGTPGELMSLRRALTLTRTSHGNSGDGGTEQPQFQESPDGTLLIPRSHPQVLEMLHTDPFIADQTVSIPLKTSLRHNQETLVEGFLDAVRTRAARFGAILKAPTGSGKTVMGIAIASRLGWPTLVVVPRAVLIEQWKERLLQHTDLTEDDIGVIRQNTLQIQGRKVVIGLIHTLYRRHYMNSVYDHFGLVIFDETHVLGAETFSVVAARFNARLRLGLSATPRRKDGMENVFLWHLGPVIKDATPHAVRPNVVMIRYYNPATSHDHCFWRGKLQLGRYLNKIAAVPARTMLIEALLRQLYAKGHHILVLSDRIKILEDLRRILNQGDLAGKIGMFTSKEKDLGKQVLLGTYGSADMGADIPRLSALVLATPRVDMVQPVGRVLRQGNPIVVDIVDTASSVMQGWAMARRRYYQSVAKKLVVKEYRTQ